MIPWQPPSEGYTPDDEGPEARLAREIAENEKRIADQHKADCEMVERLLAALVPRDARRKIISYSSQRFWNLPRRARPVD